MSGLSYGTLQLILREGLKIWSVSTQLTLLLLSNEQKQHQILADKTLL
jgi:hypothetical protein